MNIEELRRTISKEISSMEKDYDLFAINERSKISTDAQIATLEWVIEQIDKEEKDAE